MAWWRGEALLATALELRRRQCHGQRRVDAAVEAQGAAATAVLGDAVARRWRMGSVAMVAYEIGQAELRNMGPPTQPTRKGEKRLKAA